jgi:hypothetical protein
LKINNVFLLTGEIPSLPVIALAVSHVTGSVRTHATATVIVPVPYVSALDLTPSANTHAIETDLGRVQIVTDVFTAVGTNTFYFFRILILVYDNGFFHLFLQILMTSRTP